MKEEQRAVKRQLFICCNQKEGKECCADKNAASLVQSLKDDLKGKNLWDEFKVTKSGCLGPCSQGISAVLMPENILLTELSIQDKETLFSKLTN